MSVIPWLVLLVPLAGAVLIALVTRRAAGLSAFISVVAVSISFICSCVVFAKPEIRAAEIPWIDFGGLLRVPIGFTLDSLSKTMLVLVSGVGALIHIYSLATCAMTPANRAISPRSRSSCFQCSGSCWRTIS
jgi:NADH-quinone oxidoreductase subunit L